MTNDKKLEPYFPEEPNDPDRDRRALLRGLMNGTALSSTLYGAVAVGVAALRRPALIRDPANAELLEETRKDWWVRIPTSLSLGSGIAAVLLARAYMKAGRETNRRPDDHDDFPPASGPTPPQNGRSPHTPHGPHRS